MAWTADEHWGEAIDYRGAIPPRAVRPRAAKTRSRNRRSSPPGWRQPAPVEARPPRPAGAVGDRPRIVESAPPPSPAQRDAARRGTLLHSLFERLPGVAPDQRHGAALRWLERSAGVGRRCRAGRNRRLRPARSSPIRASPTCSAPDSLAEAPIAATLADGRVVAGTVDRLLVDAPTRSA